MSLVSKLRCAGPRAPTVDVLDLEQKPGTLADDEARAGFLGNAEDLLARPSCSISSSPSRWSALQYSAAVAVAERVRRLHPNAVIAVEGYDVSVRPDDFAYEGSPVQLGPSSGRPRAPSSSPRGRSPAATVTCRAAAGRRHAAAARR